jgi:hypothetical protein
MRKVIGLMTLGVALGAPAQAAAPLQSLLACRSIEDATARLACFDRESATLVQTPVAAPPAPTRTLTPEQKFGLAPAAVARQEAPPTGPAPIEADAVTSTLSSVRTTSTGRTVFTLANGQVWQTVVAEDDPLASSGETIKVSRAALGSFLLKTASGRVHRVSRLK